MTTYTDQINVTFDILVSKGIARIDNLNSRFTKLNSTILATRKNISNMQELNKVGLSMNKGGVFVDNSTKERLNFADATKIAAQRTLELMKIEMQRESIIKQINASQEAQMRQMGFMFGALFGGMQLKMFGMSIMRFVLPAMDKLQGYVSGGTQRVLSMNAGFEMLKFSMFEALTQSKLFIIVTDFLLKATNWLSRFVSKHPLLVAMLATFGSIAVVVGSIGIAAGFITQMFMLNDAIKVLVLQSKLAKLNIDGIKGKNVLLTFTQTGLLAIKNMYNSIVSKTVVIATKGVGAVGSAGTAAGTAITGMFQGAGFALGSMLSGFSWKAMGTRAGSLFSQGLKSINPIQFLLTITGGFFSKFSEQLNSFLDSAGIVGDVFRIVGNTLGILFNAVVDGLSTLGNAFLIVFTDFGKVIQWFKDWGTVISNSVSVVINWLSNLGVIIRDKVGSALEFIFNLLPGWVQSFVSWIGNVFNAISSFFSNVAIWISEKIQPVIDWALGAFSKVAGFISGIWDKVTGAVDAAANATQSANEYTRDWSVATNSQKTTTEDLISSSNTLAPNLEKIGDLTFSLSDAGFSANSQMMALNDVNYELVTSSNSLIDAFTNEKTNVDNLTNSYKELAKAKSSVSKSNNSSQNSSSHPSAKISPFTNKTYLSSVGSG